MRCAFGNLLANRFSLLLAVIVVFPVLGCSSTGSSSPFSTSHPLLPAAKDVAAAMRPTDPRELSKMPMEAFYVQPGDVLLLEVIDLDSDVRLPADQTVMPDGMIDLGEYGRLVVAGMTVEQIESIVTATVRNFHDDNQIKPINVQLNVAESAVYYVLGEVNAPGSYPLIGRETVLDAIVTAGGLADAASQCKVILSRPTAPASCRIVLPVCYNRIVQLGDTTTNYQLRPGDRVFVGSKTFCESLAFWKKSCDNCPQGACPCRCGITPATSPYATVSQPHFTDYKELMELPPSTLPIKNLRETSPLDDEMLPRPGIAE